jgi:hypothetical protein
MTWQSFVAAVAVLAIPIIVLSFTGTDSFAAILVLLFSFVAAWVVYAVINGATAVPKRGPYA